MLDEFVFDDELLPHVEIQLQHWVVRQIGGFRALTTVLQLRDSSDCWVSTLLLQPVCTCVEAIGFRSGAGERWDSSGQVGWNFGLESDRFNSGERFRDQFLSSADILYDD